MSGDGFGLKAPTAHQRAVAASMAASEAERARRRAERPVIDVGMHLQGKIRTSKDEAKVVGIVVDMPDAEHVTLVTEAPTVVHALMRGGRTTKAHRTARLETLKLADVDWQACYEMTDSVRREAMHRKFRGLLLALGVGPATALEPAELELWEAAKTLLEEAG